MTKVTKGQGVSDMAESSHGAVSSADLQFSCVSYQRIVEWAGKII